MKLYEFFTQPKVALQEGGNAFSDVVPFDHKHIPAITQTLNSVLDQTGAQALAIGSGASPTPGKISGDLDIVVDQDALAEFFDLPAAKDIRKALRALYDQAGYQTAQSGISVHVRVPVQGAAHQADIMVVPNAATVATYHTHDIPKGSHYKGVHKQIAMSKLASAQGLMWSAFQGLFNRDEKGKKADLRSNNLDEIAKLILNPNATAKDFGSLETILAALPEDRQEQLLQDLAKDPQLQ